LHLVKIDPTPEPVEDWEAFFDEKSRRRAAKERQRMRSIRLQVVFVVAVIAIVLTAVAWLAIGYAERNG
jgi:predicted nucleic acid-binding Zn ribbon protein